MSSQVILSWGYQTPSEGRTTVRNELFVVNTQSGRQEPFRSEINHDESPIENLKVSHSKFVFLQTKANILAVRCFVFNRNYLIILFREQPFELWDLKTFTLIRRLPKKCPKILALVIPSD